MIDQWTVVCSHMANSLCVPYRFLGSDQQLTRNPVFCAFHLWLRVNPKAYWPHFNLRKFLSVV